ncbi:MAG: MFS transporter [Gemmatimonadota bacterium]|nr:MFS transporter [Gemmatimonadota bacterium]MDH4347531.1 MFS transporter [Gemmatimonadota bacterium]
MLPAPRNPFQSLRHRPFRLFFAGQFVSLVGTWMQVVAQGWLVLELTDSPFYVGVVSALGSVPILFFTLWGGVLADRVHRRRALIILQSLMLVDALALATLTATGTITLSWVMLLAAIHGTSAAFEVPIRQAFIMEMVGRDDLMNAIALNSSNFNLTRILGPAVAGGVIAAAGVTPCFFLNSASFLAAIGSLVAMGKDHEPAVPRTGAQSATFREGLDYVWGREEPRALLLLTAAFSVFGFSFVPMLPVLARDVLGTGAVGYGFLMTSVGVGASAGALAMASWGHRFPAHRVIRVAGLGFGLALGIAAVSRSWPVVAAAVGLAGFAMILNNVSSNARLQTCAPDHLRGRVMGFYAMMVLGVSPLGALQAGWVSEHLGVPASLGMGAIASVAAAFLLHPAGRIPGGSGGGGVHIEGAGT